MYPFNSHKFWWRKKCDYFLWKINCFFIGHTLMFKRGKGNFLWINFEHHGWFYSVWRIRVQSSKIYYWHATLTHWGRDKMVTISQTTFFKGKFVNDNVWVVNEISLRVFPWCPFHNIPALVEVMTRHRQCNKPLSEPMMISLLIYIYRSLRLNELIEDKFHGD